MNIVAGFVTDVGLVRSINEDTHLIDDHLKLFGVADGVGGHRGGEVASTTAIETLRACIANGNTLAQAIDTANAAVYERATHDSELTGMGTTLTVARSISDTEFQFGHVGDSRAYLQRGSTLQQITSDHSMVGDLVRQGQITEEQAALHPRRNVITRAVGMEPTVTIDVIQLTVQAGDRLLICSDGITDMLRDETIALTMSNQSLSPQACAEALANQAIANGGIDNLTAVIIDIDVTVGVDTVAEQTPEFVNLAAPIAMTLETLSPAQGPPKPRASSKSTANSPGFDTSLMHVPSTSSEPTAVGHHRWWSRARWLAITVLPLVLILIASYGALKYNNSRYWYVGNADGRVALFQGSPDAPLGWSPQRRAISAVRASDIADEATQQQVLDNSFCASSSESKARACFAQFANQNPATPSTTQTTSSSTTTPTTGSTQSTRASTTTVAGG